MSVKEATATRRGLPIRAGAASDDLPFELRLTLLRQHGSFTQAYSAATQADLQHFGDEKGFIAYKNVWGTAMVLSDPVAPTQMVGDLIDRFLNENRDVAFWQISKPLALALAARGFRVNELGVETKLDLQSYTFDGQRKRNMRKAARRAAQQGFVIRECPLAALDIRRVQAISHAWRGMRTVRTREVTFLNRPVLFHAEPDVRWFFAFDRDGALAAFCVCDPIYENGAVIGYSAATRQLPDLNLMIGLALKRHAAETFQGEGRRWLTFGLSPAEGMGKLENLQRDWATRRIMRYCYNNWLFNRFIYPFQGHAAHKRQFDGTPEQTFLAFNIGVGVVRLIKLLRACNII
jgi:lysylphosphatidylglycerol synthetase-like protein (DUF2156 family)